MSHKKGDTLQVTVRGTIREEYAEEDAFTLETRDGDVYFEFGFTTDYGKYVKKITPAPPAWKPGDVFITKIGNSSHVMTRRGPDGRWPCSCGTDASEPTEHVNIHWGRAHEPGNKGRYLAIHDGKVLVNTIGDK